MQIHPDTMIVNNWKVPENFKTGVFNREIC